MKRIIFEIEDGPIETISRILRKNNLEKHLSNFYEELNVEESKEVTIILKVKELILGKISEKNFLSFLKKELQITEEQTKKIRKDIEKSLVEVAKKINTTEKAKEPEKKPSPTLSLKPSVVIGLEDNKKDSSFTSEKSPPKDEINNN